MWDFIVYYFYNKKYQIELDKKVCVFLNFTFLIGAVEKVN